MPRSDRPRRWFRIAYAGNAMRRMLDEKGLALGTLDVRAGIQAMLSFMAEYQPQHGETDELWCSWRPVGEVFEFEISRRLTRHDHPDAQVALTFVYRLTSTRAALSGERMIATLRDATPTPAYRAVADASVLEVRLA